VKSCLTEEQIAIFYLPIHSSELSPEEHLNCGRKASVHFGKPARIKTQVKEKVYRAYVHAYAEDGAYEEVLSSRADSLCAWGVIFVSRVNKKSTIFG